MSEKLQNTRAILAKHHRDGDQFAEMMRESFAGRFDRRFWQLWRRWIEPVYSPNPVVVDLGCGPGMFLQALSERTAGIRAIGVECAPYMLDAMGELPSGCERLVEDLNDPHLDLGDGSVDAAIASVLLHELTQPIKALQEIHRCLKAGGRLIITDWVRSPLERYIHEESDAQWLFAHERSGEELDDIFTHFIEHNRFTAGDLIYLLNRCGFGLLQTEEINHGRFVRIVAEKIES